MAEAEVRFKDFSFDPDPVKFRISGEEFSAPPVLPIPVMQELVGAIKTIQGLRENADASKMDDVMTAMTAVFTALLSEESGPRFTLMMEDRTGRIGVKQMMDILQWLLEVYGLRPTEASSGSSSGPSVDATGTSSPAGAPSPDSTPSS